MTSAVVFAYHNVGYRCLSVLLAHGVNIPLVVTHQDNPKENIWFESVTQLAARHGIETITPDDPNTPEFIARIQSLQPDFLFSFYYRLMLKPELLGLAPRGAFNMHGSLLPKYRGRVPVNWAVINGERETGATLHEMVEKPDAGRLVDQQAVPILPDDTAFDVFNKTTLAAELMLDRCLPGLLNGTAVLKTQDLSQSGYFYGRKPEDGRIDWSKPAQAVHNLVRGVAPPYPGAYTHTSAQTGGKRIEIYRTQVVPGAAGRTPPQLWRENDALYASTADGTLRVLDGRIGDAATGIPLTPDTFTGAFRAASVAFDA